MAKFKLKSRCNKFPDIGYTNIIFNSCFLKMDVHSEQAQHYFINKSKAITQSGIYLKELKAMPISLPPLNVQKQIVAKLETERNMIASQKEIIRMFQDKIASKLDSIWRSG